MKKMLLFVITILLVVGTTQAKYIYTEQSFASSQVATFATNTNINSEDINLENLSVINPVEYPFTVSNFKDNKISEVSQKYYIQIETTGNLPLVFEIENTGDVTENNINTNQFTCENNICKSEFGKFDHTLMSTHSYKLIVKWDENKISSSYQKEIDAVVLYVRTEQID